VTRRDWVDIACEIWAKTWEMSSWEEIEDIPANPLTPHAAFINHVRFVVESCVQLAKLRESIHGDRVNMDFLIIAAVLHDVSKLLEYEERDGKEVLSRTGELYPHGFHGARMAFDAGLPEEIVHIIVTHAPTSNEIPKRPEGLILGYVDLLDADMNRFQVGCHMWIQLTKGRR
jgi:putative nucleotidyltransferase with HDIG domain